MWKENQNPEGESNGFSWRRNDIRYFQNPDAGCDGKTEINTCLPHTNTYLHTCNLGMCACVYLSHICLQPNYDFKRIFIIKSAAINDVDSCGIPAANDEMKTLFLPQLFVLLLLFFELFKIIIRIIHMNCEIFWHFKVWIIPLFRIYNMC